ncbi:2-keto-4-pentenoate hydratase [Aneurinibacillus soli]|uniref:2-hydroxyhexa-2,4-dienoate hydratase n=1 Tax=Aneurinibacillus soli TaxID=1500254 RepID=A0A0U4NHQ2_9BACL|nr:fumarylacetoacetate hydrolase family protein [Aneurinibacillus soli]PYE64327.1 2-keto-4-pentenoate hydratase [Aneurinibacillus soli]BAU28276.1 2-hydroxyhexa-2,4-dienoate hydratase [Aneurinibacillus soli]
MVATEQITALAAKLYRADQERTPISPLTEADPNLSAEDAYRIQLEWVRLQQQAGRRIVGKKIGLTSKPMQQMMGVTEPDYGHLFDHMVLSDQDVMRTDELLQPRIEAEVAFILKRDLKGPGVTVADVLSATRYVVPSIEIIDSRISDWKIKLSDTIADNGSSARVVLGSKPVPIDGLDLQLMGMVLEKNGQQISTGAGAAALGHPAYAIAWLANKLAAYDISLHAGEIILPGAVAKAVPVEKGDHITVRFSEIGSVSVAFG